MEDQKVKNAFYQILSVFFVVLMAVLIYSVFWGPIKKYSDSLWPVKTTTVNAEGKVVIEPDIANFSFSVVTEGTDPGKIVDTNNKKVTEAITYVKSEGIDSKDVKTTQYNLNPKYTYNEKTRESYIYGYEITQTVSVKVRDLKNNLSKVTRILGGLPEYGINQISSVSFDVDEPENYLTEARNKAFEKAKTKAEVLAKAAGVKLGKIINFNEYFGPRPYSTAYEGKGAGNLTNAPSSVALPTIEPGSQELTVQVSVTYEIR